MSASGNAGKGCSHGLSLPSVMRVPPHACGEFCTRVFPVVSLRWLTYAKHSTHMLASVGLRIDHAPHIHLNRGEVFHYLCSRSLYICISYFTSLLFGLSLLFTPFSSSLLTSSFQVPSSQTSLFVSLVFVESYHNVINSKEYFVIFVVTVLCMFTYVFYRALL